METRETNRREENHTQNDPQDLRNGANTPGSRRSARGLIIYDYW